MVGHIIIIESIDFTHIVHLLVVPRFTMFGYPGQAAFAGYIGPPVLAGATTTNWVIHLITTLIICASIYRKAKTNTHRLALSKK